MAISLRWGSFKLFRVLQLLPQDFRGQDQTGQRGNGIRKEEASLSRFGNGCLFGRFNANH
jgi:hypothetical protein